MLKIISSLSFMYGMAIAILIVYGFVFYRSFYRNASQRRIFPWVFGLISIVSISFLWININAPLKLRTFSNTDHHFIRHDGFVVSTSIELGRSDSLNFPGASYNSFKLSRDAGMVNVNSGYSEDPFYVAQDGRFALLSASYPAQGHSIGFRTGAFEIQLQSIDESKFSLKINEESYSAEVNLKKGISFWNIFRDVPEFINSAAYREEALITALDQVYVLRNDVSRTEAGELRFFLSSRLFNQSSGVRYNQAPLLASSCVFTKPIPDNSSFAWGLGFLDNNRNQYRVEYSGSDSFTVLNKYPVSYPLTEEARDDWSVHTINKFLISDSRDMVRMPAVFGQGFLFSGYQHDNNTDFEPVLLTYTKNASDQPLNLQARWLVNTSKQISTTGDKMLLPSKGGGSHWLFTIPNTFDWKFATGTMNSSTWQMLLFGSLGVFILLVLLTAITRPIEKLSWVWQVLSSITLVLLATRFFFYWRYKSFPPYEGMDLPSIQQLNSPWNFLIIVIATILLALVFGSGFIRQSCG